jgi:2-dehydropantoate 2-reductase
MTSMQRDIMEGRPSELCWQNGAAVRWGQDKGIATPVNTFIFNSLLPQELMARREI